MWALLFQIFVWANRKIPWMYSILHRRHEERLLDGHTSPRFKAFNLHVNRHWKIPMDMASNGTVVAFDVFQKKLYETLHNVPGVTGIAYGMVIYGKSVEEHDKHFLSFLSVVRKNDLKLNTLKLQFQLEEVFFFGHNWSSREYHQIPRKFKPFNRWNFHQTMSQSKVSLGWSISWTDILHNLWNFPLLADNCVDYMLIINLNQNITNLSMP